MISLLNLRFAKESQQSIKEVRKDSGLDSYGMTKMPENIEGINISFVIPQKSQHSIREVRKIQVWMGFYENRRFDEVNTKDAVKINLHGLFQVKSKIQRNQTAL